MLAHTMEGDEPPLVHLTYTGEPYLVPLYVARRLRFTGGSKAPAIVPDSTALDRPRPWSI